MNEEQQEHPDHEIAASENDSHSGRDATGTRPTARFSGTGGLVVAVWKSKSEAGFDTYNVRVERTYRKEDGSFATAKNLRDIDLLRVQQLLGQADAWIEQEKAKSRGQATGSASASVAR